MINFKAGNITSKTLIILLAIFLALSFLPDNAFAQKLPPLSVSKENSAPAKQEVALDDPLGRSTPQGTLLGFIRDVDREDYERAAEYLDTRQPPKRAQQLASQLSSVLNHGLSGYLPKLSNKPEGNLEDGLRPNQEKIGVVKTFSGNYDIILERVQRGDDPPVWLFSANTLKFVPEMYRDLGHDRVKQYIPKALRSYKLFEYPAWRWVGLVLVIPLSFLIAWFITRVLFASFRFAFRERTVTTQNKELIHSIKGPIRILALSLGFYGASFFSYSLLARLFWLRVGETLLIVGLTWLCLRLIDPVVEKLLILRQPGVSSGKIAIARLLRKIVKVFVIITGAIFIFYVAGINLTAVATGLGIGGIAVAFAAQKTLENLFGGVMLIWDQPVRVGDFCRAGDYQGTVEDIGLRSTRLRTLSRTVVSIPNGQLATMSLENYNMRDKNLFRHNIQLRYETSSDQLQFLIAGIRRLLYEHPKVETSGARVRFTGFKNSGLELEIFAYILEAEHPVFLAIQEDLLLRFMNLVEQSGTSFSFPSQTTYIARDVGLNKEKTGKAVEKVDTWRKQGVLPFPDYTPDDIAEFENKLVYPESGSVFHKKA